MENIQIFPGVDELAHAAAALITTAAAESIKARDVFHWVLSGGSTPRTIFFLLNREPYVQKIHWDKVHLWWGDERCVPPVHQDSNYRMAYDAFIKYLPITESHVHRIQAELLPNQAAQAYELLLREIFISNPFPVFDLVLLGMGEDGHTASLFPHTSALSETTRWVTENYVPRLDTWRITLTAPVINAARQVAILVSGESKAQTLKLVLQSPYKPEVYPIQMIQLENGTKTWLLDAQAASQLSR